MRTGSEIVDGPLNVGLVNVGLVNVGLVGDRADVVRAMQEAGW